ncbi:MAG: L-2-hydroxyglutarate oxidase [Phycisphaerae bacterium]|nr:L-2-hydroxyglutarate oxidase [Phycisphaerae bacterium]
MGSNRIVIIGGGILGLASAHRILELVPRADVTVIEKEPTLAHHQTGNNSGVIHSGIYYKPGSLKAINCRRGKAAMEAFCTSRGIAHERCGKVIVATREQQVPALGRLMDRAGRNGVEAELIGVDQLARLEPHARGLAAIHVPETGIVDYREVASRLAEEILQAGGTIHLNCRVDEVVSMPQEQVVLCSNDEFHADWIVNCAGLQSDRLMRMSGHAPPVKIVPFRGEYYELARDSEHLCRSMIYPVPDPAFPFLGVHMTRLISGGVECGPNAVLALAREGYTPGSFNAADMVEIMLNPAVWSIMLRYWKVGAGEMHRSFSKQAFARALQELVPGVRPGDLKRAPAGVRAQALTPDGQLLDDFAIQTRHRQVHVCNAPSPAATSSLSIGEQVARILLDAADLEANEGSDDVVTRILKEHPIGN